MSYKEGVTALRSVVVVTGGAHGIGLATAKRLAADGVEKIAIWDRDVEGARAAAAEVSVSPHIEAFGIGMDQRDRGSVEKAMEATVDRFGPPDGLFANAGMATMKPFLEISEREWTLVQDVNVSGTFRVCQAVAREMVSRRLGGSIVVNISISAFYNSVDLSHYCASKAALAMLVRAMASELGLHDIRVNGVAPAIVSTGMTAPLLSDESIEDMAARTTPLGRVGQPEDIAPVVSFLLSDAAGFVTGQTLLACGGQSIPSIPAYRPLDYANRDV